MGKKTSRKIAKEKECPYCKEIVIDTKEEIALHKSRSAKCSKLKHSFAPKKKCKFCKKLIG